MNQSLSERVSRLRRFLAVDLWETPVERRDWAGRGLRMLQGGVMLAESFVRDQLLLRASALTYFTVLSLIPLLAIATSLAAAVGVSTNLDELVIDQFAAVSPEVKRRIIEAIENTRFGRLGGLGAAVLFVTSVLGITNIERSFNHIWGVKQHRSLGRRFTDYLAVLVVAPLLMGSAISVASMLESQWVVQKLLEVRLFSTLYSFGLAQVPTLMLGLAFAFLYWFLPNTRVRPAAALLGGLVAGPLSKLALSVYVGFSIGAARGDLFFGKLAWLPMLFVWIYVFWAIVLFGAEVAFAYQNLALYRREVRGRNPEVAEREAIGLQVALEIARAFQLAQPAWTDEGLADALRIPVRAVRSVLADLEKGGILAPRDRGEGPRAFMPARPAETIRVADVLAALRGERRPLSGDPGIGSAVSDVLQQLEEGAVKGSAGRTLAELLASIR